MVRVRGDLLSRTTCIRKAVAVSVLCAVVAVAVAGCATPSDNGNDSWSPEQAAAGYAGILSDRYDEVFPDDRVQTVRILMDAADWQELQGNIMAKEYYRADIWIDDELVPDVAVRTKGNSSLRSAMQSAQFRAGLKVDFNFFNSARSYHGLKKLVYNNGFSDPTLIKEFLGYELMALMGVPAPRACFVDLWVNDVHLGVYTQVEAVDSYFLSQNFDDSDGYLYKHEIGAGALDWTEADAEAGNASASQTEAISAAESINLGGGTLTEIIDRLGDEAGWIPGWAGVDEDGTEGSLAEGFSQVGPPPGAPPGMAPPGAPPGMPPPGAPPVMPPPGAPGQSDLDYLTMIGLRTNEAKPDYTGLFELLEVLNTDPDLVSAQDLEEVLQVDKVLRFLAVSVALVHLDNYIGMTHNYYLYQDGGRFCIIPWDLNMVFGGFSSNLDENRILSFYIDEPTAAAVDQYPLVQQLIDEPEYLQIYRKYLRQLVDGPFSVERMNNRIDQIADLIRPYVEKDTHMFFSLEDFERGLTESLTTKADGIPQGPERFIGLKYFVQKRTASILAQLSGALPASKGDGSGNGGVRGMGGGMGDRGMPGGPPVDGQPLEATPPTILPEGQ